jgi:dihydrolipoamide dehydrogenase
MSTQEVRVPDMGDAKDVKVVEVLVKKGDKVALEDPLITLESDKASMDVPSPVAGVIASVEIKAGDTVSAGALIANVETDAAAETSATAATSPTAASSPAASSTPPASTAAADKAAAAPASTDPSVPKQAPVNAPQPASPVSSASAAQGLDLVVLGAGPGGYTAAFRAADLGMKVTLVERWPMLGGVCLNVGCIPSKALLHAAKVIEDAADMSIAGITFAPPEIDRDKLRVWKNKVVTKLTGGLTVLAKQRKVTVVRGEAKFVGPNTLEVNGPEGLRRLDFKQCIIAAGSESVRLPGLPDDPRVIDSTGALELPAVKVTVVELSDGLMPGTDRDLVRPLQKRIEKRYEKILVKTKVAKLEASADGLLATFEGPEAPPPQRFDRVLVAVGRTANGNAVNAAVAGVQVNARGIIEVDRQMRTNVPHIFAIGDVTGAPMLAHRATHQAKVAAEVAAGHKSSFDARCIPAVAYTDPEIAWVGVTETEAKERGIDFGKGVFPWAASGRSLALNRDEGFTKLLFDKESHRIIGAGIVGTNAGELIAEAGLAIEMGADAADVGLTVHAHPTLSETVAFAAEAFEGTLTDLYIPKR